MNFSHDTLDYRKKAEEEGHLQTRNFDSEQSSQMLDDSSESDSSDDMDA